MSLQLSTTVRNARLDAFENTIGTSPILALYSGSVPANCAAARTGTQLARMTLPSDWMNNAAGGVKTLLGTWSTSGAVATGTAGYFTIFASDGSTVHAQGTVSFATTAWAASTSYIVGQKVSNGGQVYNCTTAGTSAASGGPTGTGTSITDGNATWAYVSAVGDMALDNTSIQQGQSISVSTFQLTAGNA